MLQYDFHLAILCDNAAFGGNPAAPEFAAEIARILREVADRVETGRAAGGCYDQNGNPVGSFRVRTTKR